MITQVQAILVAPLLAAGGLFSAVSDSPPSPAAPSAAASAASSHQPGGNAEDLFRRLLARSGRIRDFRARFTQKLLSRGLAPPPAESGRVFYLHPFRMRWEYENPEKKLGISDGKTGWLYLPEERRALRVDLGSTLGAGPLPDLLSGSDEARKNFKAEILPSTEGSIALKLLPTAPRQDFESLEVRAATGSLMIEEVQVIDPGGNRMIYRFSGMEENVGLPAALFLFTPPRGVEVIEQ